MPREQITYLIYCTEAPSRELDVRIQRLVGHLWYARMHKAVIIVPDCYTSLMVACECDRHDIPVRCFGVNKQARNGMRPYRRIDEDYQIIAEADACFLLGRNVKPLAIEAQRLGKRVYELC